MFKLNEYIKGYRHRLEIYGVGYWSSSNSPTVLVRSLGMSGSTGTNNVSSSQLQNLRASYELS